MNRTETSQFILDKAGYYEGEIDGDFGPLSVEAANKYYDFPDHWSNERISIGVLQVYAIRNNIPTGIIDGYWGNNTAGAYDQIQDLLGIEKEKKIVVDQNVRVKPVYNNWPKANYNDLVAFYGKIGTNQTSLTLPYEMKLAWDTDVKIDKITCHKKVKDSFERILQQVKEHYGMDIAQELGLDLYGGVLNVRKMRGGPSWSHHSFGCVMDIDPDRNRLKWGKDKAYLARLEYKPFWKIVYSEGMTGLGPERNYDYMHWGGVDYSR